MKEIQRETEKIIKEFQKIEKRPWTPEVIMLDLMEEVGELANAILVKEEYKSVKREISGLRDSIADVLYALVRLANFYKINIKDEYMKMLKELRNRIDKGEFVDD